MGAPFRPPAAAAPPRRYELLAHILERIGHDGVAPTEEEMGAALDLSRARIRAVIDQLVREDIFQRREAGSARSVLVGDRAAARALLVRVYRGMGGTAAEPMAEMLPPCPNGHLPVFPRFAYLPDVD